jgi:predicted N-acyltransferase
VLGGIAGMHDQGEFFSGYSAPFGGLDLARLRETPDNVETILTCSLEQLAALGIGKAHIKLAPACYGESQSLVQITLLNAGFTVERCELNQHLDLSGYTTVADFVAELRPPARKTLRRLMTDEFDFAECRDDSEFDRGYRLLSDNRTRKDRTLSLSREYALRAKTALGDRIRMFELFHDTVPVAAALVYSVSPGHDMVVAWGDSDHGLEKSPMILLAYRLVERALENGVEILDLGTSNIPSKDPGAGLQADLGLVQFKRSLLAHIEPRFTLSKVLAS